MQHPRPEDMNEPHVGVAFVILAVLMTVPVWAVGVSVTTAVAAMIVVVAATC